MPPRNYMVIDPRHDHSMRIPRPDLSVALGTPNACNNCHRGINAAGTRLTPEAPHINGRVDAF